MRLFELFDSNATFHELTAAEISSISSLSSASTEAVHTFVVNDQTYIFFLEDNGGPLSFSFGKLVDDKIVYSPTGDGGGFRVYSVIVQAITGFLELGLSAIKFAPYTARQRDLYIAMLERVVKQKPAFSWEEDADGDLILARKE